MSKDEEIAQLKNKIIHLEKELKQHCKAVDLWATRATTAEQAVIQIHKRLGRGEHNGNIEDIKNCCISLITTSCLPE